MTQDIEPDQETDTPILPMDLCEWHSLPMTVSWSDAGHLILRHRIMDGAYVNHTLDIGPEMASQLTEWMKNV